MTMSATTSKSADHAAGIAAPPRRRWRRRLLVTAGGLLLVLVAVAWAGGLFDGARARQPGVSDNESPTSTATVIRGTLSSQLSAEGTLGYTGGSEYKVINGASGTFSELPAAGESFSRGQVLYRVSDRPVVLLYGNTPVYRSLSEGDEGPDVRQLNRNLVALGYASRSELGRESSYFSAETRYALERLQERLGEEETGSLPEGQAVFLPGQIRISSVTAALGTSAAPATAVMQATSTSRQVVVNLDASQQSEVNIGNGAQITLPDGQATPGVVSGIGTVASGGKNATLPVYITLKHPDAAGELDQAPVTVEITTAEIRNALIVPVDSLLALTGGGYAVETVEADAVHKLVAVSLGTFDDAAGTVQVSGDLSAGERIMVPNL